MNFSSCKILIVGDVMLDKYYFGSVERISPEAPVPIVNIVNEESRLGGAANVANNIASLGGQAILAGAVGRDLLGKEIERIARHRNIRTEFIKNEQPTITKARIIGGRQQIVRVDQEQPLKLSPPASEEFKQKLSDLFAGVDLVVISDYGKGLVNKDLCHFLIEKAHEQGKRVIIDPKGINWEKYTGAELVTPNVKELGEIAGHPLPNEDTAIEEAAGDILQRFKLQALLVTRSEKGMSLITPGETRHLPTHAQEVFDVSGAGDTVVGTLALALAAGMPIMEAMHVANVAAGIVVSKIGTATLSREELEAGL